MGVKTQGGAVTGRFPAVRAPMSGVAVRECVFPIHTRPPTRFDVCASFQGDTVVQSNCVRLESSATYDSRLPVIGSSEMGTPRNIESAQTTLLDKAKGIYAAASELVYQTDSNPSIVGAGSDRKPRICGAGKRVCREILVLDKAGRCI